LTAAQPISAPRNRARGLRLEGEAAKDVLPYGGAQVVIHGSQPTQRGAVLPSLAQADSELHRQVEERFAKGIGKVGEARVRRHEWRLQRPQLRQLSLVELLGARV